MFRFPNSIFTKSQSKFFSRSSSRVSQHTQQPIKILVTGAAGQIGYSILPMIANGNIWGPHQPLVIKMLDLPSASNVMHGVRMELEDCAFPAIRGIQVYTDPYQAFLDTDVIVMLANAMILKADMPRSELLKENLRVYRETADALKKSCNKNVKILMVANPANTNCYLLVKSLENVLNSENITSLNRLDHNRAKSMVARKLGVPVSDVRKIIVWGNHSMTMYPDLRYAEYKTHKGWTKVSDVLKDEIWLKNEFIPDLRTRVSEIIRYRGKSSSLSAANAAIDHLRDWLVGTPKDDWVSMGVYSKSQFKEITPGLIFGHPCVCKDGNYHVETGIKIDDQTLEMIKISANELEEEKKMVNL